MTTPREVWSYQNTNVDDRQVFNMLRNVATDVWNQRSAPLSSLTSRWKGLASSGYRGYTWLQYAYLWARRSYDQSRANRGEIRELKAMVKALAKAQDEGHGKILDAVENAERDAIKVTAAEVAAELEAETKLNVKED